MPFDPPPPLRRHSDRVGQTSPQKISGLVISDSMQLHPAALPTFVHRSSLHRNAPSLKCWSGIKKADNAPRPSEEAGGRQWRVGSRTRFLTAPHLISTAASDPHTHSNWRFDGTRLPARVRPKRPLAENERSPGPDGEDSRRGRRGLQRWGIADTSELFSATALVSQQENSP